MREIITGKGIKPGARLDEYILSIFPALPRNALYKAFRKKDVKIGGKWAAPDAAPAPFDVINIFLPDNILFGAGAGYGTNSGATAKPASNSGANPRTRANSSTDISYRTNCSVGSGPSPSSSHEANPSPGVGTNSGSKSSPGTNSGPNPGHDARSSPSVGSGSSPGPISTAGFSPNSKLGAGFGFSVVYEDERLFIVNKMQGLPVHPDRGGSGITLVELARDYLSSDSIFMCHRIDRNTGGLVAIAKDRGILPMILENFSGGSIKKGYRCIVLGRPDPPGATLSAYMAKDQARGKVTVFSTRDGAPQGARTILTRYRTMGYDQKSGTSKLEVSLLTGRTHQIRAHLASIGHPIIGDGKYCPNSSNKRYYAPFQMLTAFRLVFPDMPGLDISGKTIEITDGLAYPRLKNSPAPPDASPQCHS